MAVRFPVPDKTDVAVTYLRSRISRGAWTINSRIPREDELMTRIGVGRSTLREAVRSLTIVGMLEPVRGVGTFVRSRTPVDGVVSSYIADAPMADVLGVRRALEIEAARQAALHRTDEQLEGLRALLRDDHNAGAERSLPHAHGQAPGSFHQLVFEASGNALLRDLHTATLAAIRDGRRANAIFRADDPELRRRDHAAIVEAIAHRDPDEAAAAMADHVEHDIVHADAGSRDARSTPGAGRA